MSVRIAIKDVRRVEVTGSREAQPPVALPPKDIQRVEVWHGPPRPAEPPSAPPSSPTGSEAASPTPDAVTAGHLAPLPTATTAAEAVTEAAPGVGMADPERAAPPTPTAVPAPRARKPKPPPPEAAPQ